MLKQNNTKKKKKKHLRLKNQLRIRKTHIQRNICQGFKNLPGLGMMGHEVNSVEVSPPKWRELNLDWRMLQSCLIYIKSKTQKDKIIAQEFNWVPEQSTIIFIKRQKYQALGKLKLTACGIQWLPGVWRSMTVEPMKSKHVTESEQDRPRTYKDVRATGQGI